MVKRAQERTGHNPPVHPSPSQLALRYIAVLMAAGLLCIILFSTPAPSLPTFLSTTSVGILAAVASALAGGLLGFLFGIPRRLQSGSPPKASEAGSTSTQHQSDEEAVGYRANTNLEDISDWLTKILVGVGLTQLTVIPSKLQSLASFVAVGLGAAAAPNVLASAILVSYGVSGFLFSYLWTRLYLAAALREADVAALVSRVEETDRKISELEKQAFRDATALSLAQRYLNPRPGTPEADEEDVQAAIIAASAPVKTTIFYQAWDVRAKNWREDSTKPIMERTIPIFRALIASDTRSDYHLNHGQLGFALKDKRHPDWAEADAELSKAIEIRGDWHVQGWLFYEFNRAICRIMLASEAADPHSLETLRQGILADLATAAQGEDLRDLIRTNPSITSWMSGQKISMEQLGS